jgi:ribosomal protein S24E
MKIYDEKIILLKNIVDELKKNGENVIVYENITENFGNFSTEFQKIYDSHM